MKLYIIRHGETEANKEGRFQGWTDNPLNEKGFELAEVTGRGMEGIRFDRCYSSPLIRAVQTAQTVLKYSGNPDVPIRTDDRLKEINMGDWENKKFRSEPGGRFSEKALHYFRDPFSVEKFPNGEHARDVCERTKEFLKELAAEDSEDVCLIAIHGFAMRAMLNFLYEDPTDFWQKHVPYNCEVNILEAKKGRIRILEGDKVYYDQSQCVDRYKEISRSVSSDE